MKYSCNVLKIILQRQNNTFIMRIEKMVDRVKEFLLWIYIMAVLIGIVYAACMGQETKTPGEIIYEKTHTR